MTTATMTTTTVTARAAGGPAGATGTAGRPGAAGTVGRPGPAGRARAAGTAGSPGTTDERTLQELQREHGPALFSFLLGLTYGDRQRAEDLAQETLVRAWQHPEAFSDAYASIRPWLFTVARRIAIDARRSRLARPAEIGDGVLAVTPDPSDPTESAEAALDVRAAVRELSPEHRAVLVRLYFHGLTVAEAARDLGIPAGTVKSRSHYALRQLGRALPGYRPRHGTVARPRAVAAQ